MLALYEKDGWCRGSDESEWNYRVACWHDYNGLTSLSIQKVTQKNSKGKMLRVPKMNKELSGFFEAPKS